MKFGVILGLVSLWVVGECDVANKPGSQKNVPPKDAGFSEKPRSSPQLSVPHTKTGTSLGNKKTMDIRPAVNENSQSRIPVCKPPAPLCGFLQRPHCTWSRINLPIWICTNAFMKIKLFKRQHSKKKAGNSSTKQQQPQQQQQPGQKKQREKQQSQKDKPSSTTVSPNTHKNEEKVKKPFPKIESATARANAARKEAST